MTQPKRRKPGKRKPKPPEPLPEFTDKQKSDLLDVFRTLKKMHRRKSNKRLD
jgi:hypothetical protein